MTTAEERQQAAEIDVAGRQERIAMMLKPEITEADAQDAAEWAQATDPNATVLPYPKPAKKTRSAPVKGLCVNCGKNYSRHKENDLKRPTWCYADRQDSPTFSLEPAPKPTPAAPAGALSVDQVDRLRELLKIRDDAKHAFLCAENVLMRADADVDAHLDSITAK